MAYFNFRRIPLAGSWTGFSEQPNFVDARPATEAVVGALTASADGRDEPRHRRAVRDLHPVQEQRDPDRHRGAGLAGPDGRSRQGRADESDDDGPKPLYEFEPEADQLIGALLPRYISARIFFALLESAASESAARRRAMKSASDNAKDLIDSYTRLANQARQAEITQEISEIVGGADALASAGSEQR